MYEDRIHSLEQKLRESEKERHRYQNEANRIKEMMQRTVMSTRHAAQIGKLILIKMMNILIDNQKDRILETNQNPLLEHHPYSKTYSSWTIWDHQ